jgi:hypothetical protein
MINQHSPSFRELNGYYPIHFAGVRSPIMDCWNFFGQSFRAKSDGIGFYCKSKHALVGKQQLVTHNLTNMGREFTLQQYRLCNIDYGKSTRVDHFRMGQGEPMDFHS